MAIDFKKELNESQYEAVVCCDAPSLVIAGAGSGKTRVLTYKIAYLLQHDYLPFNILALTFTNKAAREMRERIGRLVGDDLSRDLWMGTFHSVFARILRHEAEYIGFNSNFTIYDADDTKKLIKQIVQEQGLDDKKYKDTIVASLISEAKNALIGPAQYANTYQIIQRDRAKDIPSVHQIYREYNLRLRKVNAMDFDDLLFNVHTLFQEHEDIRKRYAERFHYILVDEYQDTNVVQDRIVWQLAKDRQRVCVVGDDAQSIYSFRGAKIDNILNFQKTYTGTKLFKLEQNYRSTQRIVGAAGSVIARNRRQIPKTIFSEKEEGEPIKVCEAYGEKEEAAIVAREIDALHRHSGFDWSDFAILYRTNSQSRTFEEELRRRNFPYRIYGGTSFYQRKEIKDTIAYCRLVVNPSDEVSLRRVINYPARGIGNTTVQRIMQCAMEHQVTMWQVIENPVFFGLSVNQGTLAKLTAFAQMIAAFSELAQQKDANQTVFEIIRKSGIYADLYANKEPDDVSRQENLQALSDGVALFVQDAEEQGNPTSLADYLQEVSLISDLDERTDDEEARNRITLMTIHSAKGLEFRAVFVVGMEEELFPSPMVGDSPSALEEERRLMYVAMTRAEERLFLTWSHSRFHFGKWQNNEKSRFLHEIDKSYFSKSTDKIQPKSYRATSGSSPSQQPAMPSPRPFNMRPLKRVTSSYTASAPAPQGSDDLVPGRRVCHDRFGEGTVESLSGTGLDKKVVVKFDNLGTKTLLLRFAKFKIL
ncbi:MAG: UvrD-helicase domain-containing protein [Bacteroidaceae bacterium]|nr:UvrD-helicase domain-containing protein [Bacteroidaceae bacterium]